ncbi:MAG: MoxR family ATPase [Oscillospiraceae bacterium]
MQDNKQNDNVKVINKEEFEKAYKKIEEVQHQINKVVLGKKDIVTNLIASILAKGHILVEDVPGVGKTTMATAFSKAMSLDYKRVQFTPDVMPSDITGFSMFNKKTGEFEFKKGAAMSNVLLADEINRTSPKTQSALLEVMEEGSVTVDGVTYQIPSPFFVVATQNPLGFIGTQQLPESQLDRFIMKTSMGYPSPEIEVKIINQRKTSDPLERVESVASAEDIIQAQMVVQSIHIDQSVSEYIINLVSKTRSHSQIELGASPRASLSLMKLAQATAFMKGRTYVIPDDVLTILFDSLNHRISLKNSAKLNGITIENVIDEIKKETPIPIIK